MDKKNVKRFPLPPLNHCQIDLFKRLTDYEQNIIQYLRLQTNTIKSIQESINNKSEKLKVLESAVAKHYEHSELVEVYKTNLQKGINSLQVTCEEISQGTHDTFTTLIKLDNLAFTIEHKIKEKEAKNKEENSVLDKELHIVKEELNFLEVSEANERNEHDHTYCKIKNDIDNDYRDTKTEETEIARLVNEENEKDNDLRQNKSDLNDLEQCVITLNHEIGEGDVETTDLEKNLNQCKFELDVVKLNLDESIEAELNVKNYIQKTQSEISAIEADNSRLQEDKSFQCLIDEKRNHDIQVTNLEECVNKFKEDYSLLESEIGKEKAVRECLQEEHFRLNSEIDNSTDILNKTCNQAKALKNKDTSQIAKCKMETKATFDEILLKSTSINEFKRQVADLEHLLATIPFINDEDIPFVNQKIVNLKRSIDDKIVQMDKEFQEFTSNQNRLKENKKKEVIEKLDMIQNLTKDLNIKIGEVVKVERTANITYQANLVECDVFAKKLKDKMTIRHNLKKQIVNFKQPVVPQRRKRAIDESSEASDTAYENFTNILDIHKYMLAKKGKKK
nr:interaptin-like [Onthophagus taurus]XP_022911421.1 interaptin-like [Onthophagus taurus]